MLLKAKSLVLGYYHISLCMFWDQLFCYYFLVLRFVFLKFFSILIKLFFHYFIHINFLTVFLPSLLACSRNSHFNREQLSKMILCLWINWRVATRWFWWMSILASTKTFFLTRLRYPQNKKCCDCNIKLKISWMISLPYFTHLT